MKCRALNLSQDFKGRTFFEVEIDKGSIQEARELYDALNGSDLSVEVKKWREKRSLDANAYFWTLCGKLASKLGTTKESIYREFIKGIGNNFEIVCVKDEAVKKLRQGWEHNGVGWVTETTSSKLKGCTNVFLYYGSSTYDSGQMSHLIDLVVEECKAQGIPTETPDEIASMLARWADVCTSYKP